MRKSPVTLHLHGRKQLPVLSEADVKVQYKLQWFKSTVISVEGSNQLLSAQNWQSQILLDWPGLCAVHVDNRMMQTRTTGNFMSEFLSVFEGSLGNNEGHYASITMNASLIPKWYATRPVPFSIKKKVEDELSRLEEEGIIEPVKMWSGLHGMWLCGRKKQTSFMCRLQEHH